MKAAIAPFELEVIEVDAFHPLVSDRRRRHHTPTTREEPLDEKSGEQERGEVVDGEEELAADDGLLDPSHDAGAVLAVADGEQSAL